MQRVATRRRIAFVLAFVGAVALGSDAPLSSPGKVDVVGTRLSFDPKSCKEGEGGFAWGLGSVRVKVLRHEEGYCVFDYQWEVEGGGNHSVYRVRVPVDSGPVVIDARESRPDKTHHWSTVYTSFLPDQAVLVRRMRFGWCEVPVGEAFVAYGTFRAGDDAPGAEPGDNVTLRIQIFTNEQFNTPTAVSGRKTKWVQRVTTRIGERGKWHWVEALAEGMTPYEIRRIKVPAELAGPAKDWGPGLDPGATLYAEMQLIDIKQN